MQRRVMTEKEKRDYERKITGKVAPKELFHTKKGKRMTVFIIVGIIVFLGTFSFLKLRPMTIARLLDANYTTVEFSNPVYEVPVETVKKYSIKEAFPGSFGDTERYDCSFYDKESNLIGIVTFIAGEPYFYYNNQVYYYEY